MSSRYILNDISVAAGTAILAPQTTTWQLENQILTRLEVDIPNGHNGNTGIRVLRSQQQVIPWSNNKFLVANDRLLTIEYGEELTESKLVVITYNTDVYDHTFFLRATITDLPLPGGGSALAAPVIPTALFTSASVPLR